MQHKGMHRPMAAVESNDLHNAHPHPPLSNSACLIMVTHLCFSLSMVSAVSTLSPLDADMPPLCCTTLDSN